MKFHQILFSFKGRIPRKTFWLAVLGVWAALVIYCFVVVIAMGLYLRARRDAGETGGPSSRLLARAAIAPAMLFALWTQLAIQAKRWHDRGKPALWLLINLIPYAGWLWSMIELGFFPGTLGESSYGADPMMAKKTT